MGLDFDAELLKGEAEAAGKTADACPGGVRRGTFNAGNGSNCQSGFVRERLLR